MTIYKKMLHSAILTLMATSTSIADETSTSIAGQTSTSIASEMLRIDVTDCIVIDLPQNTPLSLSLDTPTSSYGMVSLESNDRTHTEVATYLEWIHLYNTQNANSGIRIPFYSASVNGEGHAYINVPIRSGSVNFYLQSNDFNSFKIRFYGGSYAKDISQYILDHQKIIKLRAALNGNTSLTTVAEIKSGYIVLPSLDSSDKIYVSGGNTITVMMERDKNGLCVFMPNGEATTVSQNNEDNLGGGTGGNNNQDSDTGSNNLGGGTGGNNNQDSDTGTSPDGNGDTNNGSTGSTSPDGNGDTNNGSTDGIG